MLSYHIIDIIIARYISRYLILYYHFVSCYHWGNWENGIRVTSVLFHSTTYKSAISISTKLNLKSLKGVEVLPFCIKELG